MLLAVISDTHLPRGQRRLPLACVRVLKRADLILHAGDLFSLSVLRELELHAPVAAVRGNVDAPELPADIADFTGREEQVKRLCDVLSAGTASNDPGAVRIAVVAGAGGLGKTSLALHAAHRVRRRFPDADAVVFGHSHLPEHRKGPDGFQVFNPGSPTDRRRAPHHTMGIARARDGAVAFELVALD